MASDHPPLHLSLPVVSDSDDRPDLLAFDRALWYAEEEGTLNSVVIVEFKKPMRTDFSKGDPSPWLRRRTSPAHFDQLQNAPVRKTVANRNCSFC